MIAYMKHDAKKHCITLLPGLVTALCAWAMMACSETDYMRFDTHFAGIYFPEDTVRYSFGVTPIETRSYTVRIPVCLVGKPAGEDRTISYTIVAEGTNATEGQQFVIGQPLIEGDSIRGYIPVTIQRDALEGNYNDGYKRYRLKLQLTAGGDLTPTMSADRQTCVLTFDNAVEQPNWFDYKGDKVWHRSELGEWHPLKFIKLVEFFHAFGQRQPETYAKMVATYGENLENVEYGDFYLFRTIMSKYIFAPMYDYFNDPAVQAEIRAQYPDFPFDFPNPMDKKVNI